MIARPYSRRMVANRQVLSSPLCVARTRVPGSTVTDFFHRLGPPERTNQPSFDEITRYIRRVRTNFPLLRVGISYKVVRRKSEKKMPVAGDYSTTLNTCVKYKFVEAPPRPYREPVTIMFFSQGTTVRDNVCGYFVMSVYVNVWRILWLWKGHSSVYYLLSDLFLTYLTTEAMDDRHWRRFGCALSISLPNPSNIHLQNTRMTRAK